MVTISTHRNGAWQCVDVPGTSDDGPVGARRLFHIARGVIGSLFAAELVLPEADPQEVRSLLIEAGYLDAAALPDERRPALVAFQRASGLRADGHADGRTVSALARVARERREMRDLGLA
ncbi:hypothetical protein HNR23_002668 [Nocardiopsis mwathae]|uniref:Peptidoglycan binding-like domain-containing protein n=1 Tax=Nocardiopsis mwathae TaxID=1472723 RepID=A0A7X0D5T6_9ACTN|nr:hypothetical protein [Nocardiopsis mwathae]MBB6172608.1 hypothetical protein [Nocardiopsis mwathae]